MAYADYQAIRTAISNRAAFDGNSASGYRYENGHYRVYSYATPILSVNPRGAVVFFDNRYYSRTASRLQSIIRETLPDVTGGFDAGVCYDYPENA